MSQPSETGSTSGQTVAIVGAGIVGVATAIWAQRAGHRVVLIDREGPAAGTSFGNAGLLASASIVPVTTPSLWRRAPAMVLNPDSPLFLRWRYLPQIAPWLVRFLSHARDAKTRAAAAAWMPLIGDSLADHQALADGTGADRWIVPSDYLYYYGSQAAYQGSAYDWDIKRSHGFQPRELAGQDLAGFDPFWQGRAGFGALLGNHGRISDPGAYVSGLADHFTRQGGQLVIGSVEAVLRDQSGVTGLRANGDVLPCDQVVITAGAWSGPLMRDLGLSLPLETERGYHIELWGASSMPKVPTMITAGQFVMTPMEGRLRLAGIVELGGLKAGPSKAPFALLRRHLARMFPDLTWETQTEWMGHRPTLSDSIPAIGEVPGAKGVFVGFGHQHLGLTGGAKTGRLLAQLLSGQRPNLDLGPYRVDRFR